MPTRINDSHLEDCRSMLLAKREALIKTLSAQQSEKHEFEKHKGIEVQTVVLNFPHLNLEVERRTLAEVELSLKRLDNGTYGRCGSCGEQIPSARLKALPWTRVCLDCAGGGLRRSLRSERSFEAEGAD